MLSPPSRPPPAPGRPGAGSACWRWWSPPRTRCCCWRPRWCAAPRQARLWHPGARADASRAPCRWRWRGRRRLRRLPQADRDRNASYRTPRSRACGPHAGNTVAPGTQARRARMPWLRHEHAAVARSADPRTVAVASCRRAAAGDDAPRAVTVVAAASPVETVGSEASATDAATSSAGVATRRPAPAASAAPPLPPPATPMRRPVSPQRAARLPGERSRTRHPPGAGATLGSRTAAATRSGLRRAAGPDASRSVPAPSPRTGWRRSASASAAAPSGRRTSSVGAAASCSRPTRRRPNWPPARRTA